MVKLVGLKVTAICPRDDSFKQGTGRNLNLTVVISPLGPLNVPSIFCADQTLLSIILCEFNVPDKYYGHRTLWLELKGVEFECSNMRNWKGDSQLTVGAVSIAEPRGSTALCWSRWGSFCLSLKMWSRSEYVVKDAWKTLAVGTKLNLN